MIIDKLSDRLVVLFDIDMGEKVQLRLDPIPQAYLTILCHVILGLIIGEVDSVRGFIQTVPGDKIDVGGDWNPFFGD